jgi:hypothetical protein
LTFLVKLKFLFIYPKLTLDKLLKISMTSRNEAGGRWGVGGEGGEVGVVRRWGGKRGGGGVWDGSERGGSCEAEEVGGGGREPFLECNCLIFSSVLMSVAGAFFAIYC